MHTNVIKFVKRGNLEQKFMFEVPTCTYVQYTTTQLDIEGFKIGITKGVLKNVLTPLSQILSQEQTK